MAEEEIPGLELRFRFNDAAALNRFQDHVAGIVEAEDERPIMTAESGDCLDSGDEEFYTWTETQAFFPNRIRETTHHYWRRTIQCPGKPAKTRTWRTKDVVWHIIDNPSTPPY